MLGAVDQGTAFTATAGGARHVETGPADRAPGARQQVAVGVIVEVADAGSNAITYTNQV